MATTDWSKEFYTYHQANPHMLNAYIQFADEAYKRTNQLSINMISERIRWETVVYGTGNYKVQNSFRSYYARLLMWKFPHYRKAFSIKRIDIDGKADLHDTNTWNKFYWSKF